MNSVDATRPPAPARVLSPLGTWVQKAASPTDSLKNIETAKRMILDQLRGHPEVTLAQLRKAGAVTPAALHSALLLLKQQGLIRGIGPNRFGRAG